MKLINIFFCANLFNRFRCIHYMCINIWLPEYMYVHKYRVWNFETQKPFMYTYINCYTFLHQSCLKENKCIVRWVKPNMYYKYVSPKSLKLINWRLSRIFLFIRYLQNEQNTKYDIIKIAKKKCPYKKI